MLTKILTSCIRLYQWFLSPFLGQQCRFYPTCSTYGIEALELHGPWKGSWLILKRLGRCQPWGSYGYDPVPSTKNDEQCACKAHLGTTNASIQNNKQTPLHTIKG